MSLLAISSRTDKKALKSQNEILNIAYENIAYNALLCFAKLCPLNLAAYVDFVGLLCKICAKCQVFYVRDPVINLFRKSH